MNDRNAILVAALTFAAALAGCESNDKPKETAAVAPAPDAPLTRRDDVEVAVTASVQSVNYETRMLTLKDKKGYEITFRVSDSVQRLNEVRPGDEVTARYKATLLAELRPPNSDEAANPIVAVDAAGRSPQGYTPAAGTFQAFRVVTTVEAVDVPNMRVTLRGPMGDLSVVRAKDAEKIKRIRVGDTIVITYTESTAISLDKLAPR